MSVSAAAAKLLQSCPTRSSPMNCSLPGSSVHGIFQARVLEWGAIASSAEYSMEIQIGPGFKYDLNALSFKNSPSSLALPIKISNILPKSPKLNKSFSSDRVNISLLNPSISLKGSSVHHSHLQLSRRETFKIINFPYYNLCPVSRHSLPLK